MLRLGGLLGLAAACQPARYSTREPPRGLSMRVNLLGYVPYAPLLLMKERGLLQQRVPGLFVEWKVIPRQETVHEALLTGGLDVAVGSPTTFLRLRDQGVPVRALAGISEVPIGVLCNRPGVRSLRDLAPGDRIGVPDADSHEATILRLAALQETGDPRAFDGQLVGTSVGEGFGLLRGRRELSALVAATPYLDLGRDTTGLHTLTAGVPLPPLTTVLAYTLPDLRERRPSLFEAFVNALDEAASLVAGSPGKLAKLLNEAEELDLSPPTLARYVVRPGAAYGRRIRGLVELSRFLGLTGQIEGPPPAWRDLAFAGTEGT